MAKKNYSITIDGEAFDVTSNQALPLEGKTGSELVAVYNDIAVVAATVDGFDPRKTEHVAKFKDKETGIKRIAALHSSVVAFVAGQAAEAGRVKTEKAPKAAKPKKEKINGARPVEPVEPVAAAAEASPAKGKRGKPATLPLKTIHILDPESRRLARRKVQYVNGMTVADYLEAAQAGGYTLGAAVEHVNYDKRSGLLDLRDPC